MNKFFAAHAELLHERATLLLNDLDLEFRRTVEQIGVFQKCPLEPWVLLKLAGRLVIIFQILFKEKRREVRELRKPEDPLLVELHEPLEPCTVPFCVPPSFLRKIRDERVGELRHGHPLSFAKRMVDRKST